MDRNNRVFVKGNLECGGHKGANSMALGNGVYDSVFLEGLQYYCA